MPTRPDFLLIGAAKSGTTWLAEGLAAHPRVAMADQELHYFSRHYDQPFDWYRGRLPAARDGLVGEHSNTYLYQPEAAARILDHCPDALLIVALRHPVERAYSDYCMHYRRGSVDDRIEHHLDPRGNPSQNLFLHQGQYAQHLERFWALFPPQQIHVVLFDTIARRDPAALEPTFQFLGLAPPGEDAMPREAVNARPEHRPPKLFDQLNAVATRVPLTRRMVRAVPRGLRQRLVSQVAQRRIDYPRLSPRLARALASFYADDITALEQRLALDLDHWRRHQR